MTTASQTWTEEFVKVAGGEIQYLKGGTGEPLFVLHNDSGNPGWLPLHEELARQFTVYAPSQPGYGKSERPTWMRSVRDAAVVYQWMLSALDLKDVTLVGLGFGGWIAAEMATMAPRGFKRLVLVGAMGILPAEGEIYDQSLVSTTRYMQESLHNQDVFAQTFGEEPDIDQLEAWEIHREMTFRIAWKPYMYSQTLPHLLGGVQAQALLVWGDDDRIVPRGCAERYAAELPNARLEIIPDCGHLVALEKPRELAALIAGGR